MSVSCVFAFGMTALWDFLGSSANPTDEYGDDRRKIDCHKTTSGDNWNCLPPVMTVGHRKSGQLVLRYFFLLRFTLLGNFEIH